MKRNHVMTMPLRTSRRTRSLQASACALAQLLLLVLTPWLHAHPDEDHGATDGHAYHLHRVVAVVAGGQGRATYEAGDDPHHTDGVALTPEEAFGHLLSAAAPQVAGHPSSPEAKNRLATGDLLFAARADGGPPPALLAPVSFLRLSPYPESSLPSRRRILLLGTDLPPPLA